MHPQRPACSPGRVLRGTERNSNQHERSQAWVQEVRLRGYGTSGTSSLSYIHLPPRSTGSFLGSGASSHRNLNNSSGWAMRTLPVPLTQIPLRFFDPATPPKPPCPAAFSVSVRRIAILERFSPAGPITRDREFF